MGAYSASKNILLICLKLFDQLSYPYFFIVLLLLLNLHHPLFLLLLLPLPQLMLFSFISPLVLKNISLSPFKGGCRHFTLYLLQVFSFSQKLPLSMFQ